jgi:hypothetical protein
MLRRIATLLVPVLLSCTVGANKAISPGNGLESDDDDAMQDDTDDTPDETPGEDPDDPGDGDTNPPNGDHDAGHDTPRHDAGSHHDADGGSTPEPIPPCGGPDTPCTAPADCTAEEFAGHTYFFCTTSLVWADARATCQAAHTDLAIIDDQAENDFVTSKLKGESWLGINDQETEGSYVWIVPGTSEVSGAAQSFTAWAGSQPDNCLIFGTQHCAMIQTDGFWNDVACADGCLVGGPRNVLCESY